VHEKEAKNKPAAENAVRMVMTDQQCGRDEIGKSESKKSTHMCSLFFSSKDIYIYVRERKRLPREVRAAFSHFSSFASSSFCRFASLVKTRRRPLVSIKNALRGKKLSHERLGLTAT
jgi:hypothetical protein